MLRNKEKFEESLKINIQSDAILNMIIKSKLNKDQKNQINFFNSIVSSRITLIKCKSNFEENFKLFENS